MRTNLPLCRWLVFVAALSVPAAAQATRVDLRQWGYKEPEARERYQASLSSQVISVAPSGDVVVAFVTRDRTGLATRELPALSLHVVRFSKLGEFLSQGSVPTPNWYDNSVYYGSNDGLLVRAGPKLYVFSLHMVRLALKDLPPTPNSVTINWRIYPLPDRDEFLLYNFRHTDTSISLLRWSDLKPIKECSFSPSDQLLSTFRNNLLSLRASLAAQPLRRTVDVAEICGPNRFSYSWNGQATHATLIDDDSFLVGEEDSSINFVVNGKVQWNTAFNKKSDIVSGHTEVAADGSRLAIAVKTFRGGNRFLDISRKLKGINVLLYQAKNGQRVLKVPVWPTPTSTFDFALSSRGDVLAILSDGFVELVSLMR